MAEKSEGSLDAGDQMERKSRARDVDGMDALKRAAMRRSAAAEASLAKHTVASGESLSAIANQYYGSAAKEKWMAIYEANKDVIGDNPSLIKPGQVLKIPRLSE